MARGLRFRIKEVEGLNYPHSENKGTDQLRSYCAADLRHCFRICKKLVFSYRGSYNLHSPTGFRDHSMSFSLSKIVYFTMVDLYDFFLHPDRVFCIITRFNKAYLLSLYKINCLTRGSDKNRIESRSPYHWLKWTSRSFVVKQRDVTKPKKMTSKSKWLT